ncbi:MAG: prepilin-type N-terminal cleavage/methylation domain-containing protein [Phycisphaerales bacterium]|nr:prepilin-type N-terminal cleavage/methylation domain-containing protein [Phycisphaerales bacterium]
MLWASQCSSARTPRRFAFTLVELLTVIAIISLLIGILVPSLSKARDQAKNTKTSSTLAAISSGLEMFQNENDQETRGYPPSLLADDPTEEGQQTLFGAQTLVRYLMGKDTDGYVPRRNVPRDMLQNPAQYWEQRDWYASEPTPNNPVGKIGRVGPYLDGAAVKLAAPKDIPNMSGTDPFPSGPRQATDTTSGVQPVILDTFGYPVLYYRANPLRAQNTAAAMATRYAEGGGIYNMADNALFTGLCQGTQCDFPWWDFGAGEHPLKDFGPTDPPTRQNIANDTKTFCYYILNQQAFESTNRQSLVPVRKDSFILITAGKDGLFGTKDDVNNLQR